MKSVKGIGVILIAIALLCVSTGTVAAKPFQVGATASWVFGGKATIYNGEINIVNSGSFGINASMEVKPQTHIEFFYNRQDTRLEEKEWPSGAKQTLFDMSMEYYQAGVLQESQGGKVRPYGVFTLGAVRLNPKDALYNDEWEFAVSLGGGVKVHSDKGRFGLRLQARLLLPILWGGGGFYFGSGGGGVGISAGSSIAQIDLGGGILIAFGD
jgi:hypothetical protein